MANSVENSVPTSQHSDNCSSENESEVDVIHNWSKSSKNVVIVTAGKSGVGKSHFLNTFLRLEEDRCFESQMQPGAVTSGVKYCDEELHGVNVRVVDMPGLHSIDHDKVEVGGLIGELSAVTKGGVDVVFFCMNLTSRIDIVDLKNLETLNKAFGTRIWEHVVFIFTRADTALHDGYSLEQLLEKFIAKIHEELVVKRKLAVNVGIRSIYSFPSADMFSDESEINKFNGIVGIPVSHNPNIPPEWRITLLLQVIRKCKQENIPAFLRLQSIDWYGILNAVKVITTASASGAVLGSAVGMKMSNRTAGSCAALGSVIGGFTGFVSVVSKIQHEIYVRSEMEKRARCKIIEMLKKEKEPHHKMLEREFQKGPHCEMLEKEKEP